MGVFDESKCNCCVCPMQCVLEQLVGEEPDFILTPNSIIQNPIITNVSEFIVSTSNVGSIPVSQVTRIAAPNLESIITRVLSALKPIMKSKGECACCEVPMTNLLMPETGNNIGIESIGPSGGLVTITLLDIGKGIVVGPDTFGSQFNIFSTCAITRVSS
ncbi:hypothetical protein [Chengkuizengella axinellae]|uniref:Uncharacterized protein n=1 Tax=Chengkuizengella axinellae TaxID=3064388 RepID=A0ABT9IV53_9BACL|nr:hypothetical protein [Chengkuizengella sp. 2205SS18-9]MDP5273233.1 hypothetical protein [Chengkuizengella sp. 2205SS18-9]